MVSNSQINLGGSGKSYCHIKLTGNTFAVGDVITFNSEVTAAMKLTSTDSNSKYVSNTNNVYTVTNGDVLVGKSDLYIWKTDNQKVFKSLTITRPAPSTDPVIEASDVKIAYDATSGEIAYSITNPASGVSLTAEKTTGDWISNVAVSSDKVTFSATANTGVERTGTITLKYTGATDKVITVTQRRAPVEQTTTVTETTTWDWTKTGATENIVLSDQTTPKKTDEVILANIPDINNDANFNSAALKVIGEYMVRDAAVSGKTPYFQGSSVKFTTTVPGYVEVTFSNTGSNRPYRYLNINGNNSVSGDNAGTKTSSVKVYVPAGEVKITGHYTTKASEIQKVEGEEKYNLEGQSTGNYQIVADQLDADQFLRVYSIKFTKAESADKSVTLGANGYSTYCSDYAFTATGADVYKATYANSKASLVKVEGAVPAGEGVILKGTQGASVTIAPVTTKATAFEANSNALVGVSSVTTGFVSTGTNYVLASNGTETAFIKKGANTSVDMMVGKSYLNVPASPAKIAVVFDEATAIKNVATENAAVKTGKFLEDGKLVIKTANGIFTAAGARIK